MKFKAVCIAVLALSLLGLPQTSAASSKNKNSVAGAQGQVLKVSKSVVKNNSKITVTGTGFDESVGIYVGFCVVPAAGQAPTPCGGGVNKSGTGDSSFWISSNPPPYAVNLVEPFAAGGNFKLSLTLSRKIGAFDCAKVKCAVTVRADHLRGSDRSFDLFIPITIKK
jgi:hypothetical protein